MDYKELREDIFAKKIVSRAEEIVRKIEAIDKEKLSAIGGNADRRDKLKIINGFKQLSDVVIKLDFYINKVSKELEDKKVN